MSYEPTNWKTGDVVTSAKLNKIEGGVSEMSEAYEPTVWKTGDVVTSAKLNKIEQALADATAENWTTVFDDEVTTEYSETYSNNEASLQVSSAITADTIKVTFDGTEYECQNISPQAGVYMYGGYNIPTDDIDFSEYPFFIVNTNEILVFTEQEGTHALKIEVPKSSGGSGSSDFSIANVTFVNEYGFGVNADFCELSSDFDTTVIIGVAGVPTGTTYSVIPLYQGAAHVLLGKNDNLTIETSGEITFDDNNDLLIIEGDGRVTFRMTINNH